MALPREEMLQWHKLLLAMASDIAYRVAQNGVPPKTFLDKFVNDLKSLAVRVQDARSDKI